MSGDFPAFPRTYTSDGHNGMGLRDWFAGQALAGFTALMHDDGDAVLGAADAARAAYNYADAMMAERKRRQDGAA